MNYWQGIDIQTLNLLNNSLGGRLWLDALARFFAVYGVYFFVAGLAVYWFVARNRLGARKSLVVAFTAFVLSRGILTEIIRFLFPRQRPFLQHEATQYVAKGNEPSFPSGHAAAMFAIAFAIYFYNKSLGKWLLLISLLVGIARVMVGIHFPSDILGGLVVGLFSAWVVDKLIAGKLDNLTAKFSAISDKLFGFTKR